MKCKSCGKDVFLKIGWKTLSFRCTACGKEFPVKDYLAEIDDETWERISRRPCNRAW